MIIDHRTYTLKPNRVSTFVNLCGNEAVPIMEQHLGGLIGFFQVAVGPLNQVVHLWGYKDMGDMEARRKTRDADPRWQPYRDKIQDMIMHQENKILVPVPFSPIK